MKKWRYSLKRTMLLSLTTALVGGCAANCMVLQVQAKMINRTSGNIGQTQIGISACGSVGEEQLDGDEKKIYDALKSAARQVASDQLTSTEVYVEDFSSLRDSEGEINGKIRRILSYLLMDCPYDLYWYDKNGGCSYTWRSDSDGGNVLSMTISMSVAGEYQGADPYTVDRAKIKKASAIPEEARAIVSRHQNESDYEKLKSYMTEICNRVSYDWDTYDKIDEVSYGNPWQVIPVFDRDGNTNAVCEGYAKAFQYLCDLSTFQDARCYTVEGTMSGGIGNGPHMWNIVTLEGSNYLVDVTNCDEGSVGSPDQLFLVGTEGSAGNGYTVSLRGDNGSITYEYNANQYSLLGDALVLSSYSYEDPEDLKLTVTAPLAEVTFGDPVDYHALVDGKAVNGRGEEVSGAFSWADDVTFYGNAGTNTLNAVFTPDDSRYEPVENIRVSVKVNPRPVTVTAEEKSKIYGQPDPELTYTCSNVVEGYPLSGNLTRTSGESVGTYSILQGDLTDGNNPNYTINFTGNNFVIMQASNNRAIEFVTGNGKTAVGNGVTIKSDPSYGDLWSDIVRIGSITARTASGNDSEPGHFTLQESGAPAVGDRQIFHVLYNGTIGGQTYRNEIVCEGTVDVKRRVIQVSAGSYKISKAYDKTRAGGTASGQLSLNNLLSADVNRINVTAEPTGYADANVSGQGTMEVNLTLNGAAANNYELGNRTVEVPCEITPKQITPTVKVSGSYSYTSRAITPTITVADGTDVLAASDYDMALTNNTNAGTAKVTVRPKRNGNYTWSPAVEASFTIDKADYMGTKTASTSMEYGGTAVFSLYSMVPAGYKLGEIRIEDKERIFAETPSVSGTVLSCKLVNDRSKEGKKATITLPVEESANYHAYNLTFTVTMAAQRSDTKNQTPTYSSNGNETGQTSAPSSQPVTDIQDGQLPASVENEDDGESPSANVTSVDRENAKSGRTGEISIAPIIGGAIGIALAAGIVGGTYFIRRKRNLK